MCAANFGAEKIEVMQHTDLGQKLTDRVEGIKASIGIKCQFSNFKVCYQGLAQNTAQLHTLFALSNLSQVAHIDAVAGLSPLGNGQIAQKAACTCRKAAVPLNDSAH